MMTLEAGSANDFADELQAIADRLKNASMAGKAEDVSGSIAWVKRAYKARRARDAIFARGLFGEPSWDIMLDLYRSHLEGERVGISSACIASGVASTTALRHIDVLIHHGLATRIKDDEDGRRSYLKITDKGLAQMERVYRRVSSAMRTVPRTDRG